MISFIGVILEAFGFEDILNGSGNVDMEKGEEETQSQGSQ